MGEREAVEYSGGEVVHPVAMCEVAHIFLRPGHLYRPYVAEGCKECEALAAVYAAPSTGEEEGA